MGAVVVGLGSRALGGASAVRLAVDNERDCAWCGGPAPDMRTDDDGDPICERCEALPGPQGAEGGADAVDQWDAVVEAVAGR
jgi:hypothetical protein